METYDILMLIVLIGTAIYGAMKGFAWQVASIGSIVVSYIVAYRYREPFSQSISADPPWNRFLAMLILYVGTSLVIWVAFRMVSKTIDRMKLREFDRHVGAVFGAAKGVLYCTLITLFAATLLGPTSRQKIVQSRSGYYISKVLTHSTGVMPEEVQQVIGPYIDRFDQQMKSGGQAPAASPTMPWSSGGTLPWSSGSNTQPGSLPPAASPWGNPAGGGSLWPGGSNPADADPRQWLPADLFQQAQQNAGDPSRR